MNIYCRGSTFPRYTLLDFPTNLLYPTDEFSRTSYGPIVGRNSKKKIKINNVKKKRKKCQSENFLEWKYFSRIYTHTL